MLYQIYETQRTLMEPLAEFAKASSKLFRNPINPLGALTSGYSPKIAAAYDLMYRLGKDYVKPEFDIREVESEGVKVAIHERLEMDKPFCQLLRFKRLTDDKATLERMKNQPVVLIVAPLSGHYSTLLRDTVRTMLKDHKVFITDWKNARLVPLEDGTFNLDDYVNYVQEFIRHIQAIHGNCHTVSVCQPTVPVLAAVSLMASRGEKTPISMTMMGGPIDARKSPTSVNNLAMERPLSWFENNVIYRVPINFPGAGRLVYPGFMQHTGFVAMNPRRHANNHYDYFKNLVKGDERSAEAHRKFYDEYNAVLDMDASYYLETLAAVFQDFRLVKGTWDVRNPEGKIERVKPQDITAQTSLITVEGELDDISGDGQTEAAHGLCKNIPASQRQHVQVAGAGHYGIFSGSKWREVVYPQVRDFILAADKKSSTKKAVKAAKPATAASKKVATTKAVAAGPAAKATRTMTQKAAPKKTAVSAAQATAVQKTPAKKVVTTKATPTKAAPKKAAAQKAAAAQPSFPSLPPKAEA